MAKLNPIWIVLGIIVLALVIWKSGIIPGTQSVLYNCNIACSAHISQISANNEKTSCVAEGYTCGSVTQCTGTNDWSLTCSGGDTCGIRYEGEICDTTNKCRCGLTCTYNPTFGNSECVPTTSCSDSDGGLNYVVKGTTTKGSTSFTDVCESSSQIKEYYCDAGNIVVMYHGCTCSNGVCTNERTCTDSDQLQGQGYPTDNYLSKGTVTSNLEGTQVDVCADSTKLTEYYCTAADSFILSKTIDCATHSPYTTCQSGRCIAPACNPNCVGKCGGVSDGCGGTCNTACEEDKSTRKETCLSNSNCGVTEVCIGAGELFTKRCYDQTLDSCTIECASASCTVNFCHASGCYVPGEAFVVTGLSPYNCVNCVSGGSKLDTNVGASSCCSGQVVGDICKFGTITDKSQQASKISESISMSSIKGMTTGALLEHACVFDNDCKGDNSTCKSFAFLINSGYMIETQKSTFYDTLQPVVSNTITGLGLGTLAGGIACYGLAAAVGAASGGIGAIPVASLCTGLVIGGAAGGAVLGGTYGYGSIEYVNGIQEKDANKNGVCVVGGSVGGGDFCSWFDFLKPMLGTNADKSCIVGAVFAALVLLVLLKGISR
jgi:hypothetical protein